VSTTTSKYTQPALIGGAVLGVLSSLPVISAGNVCCCLWVISGGMVAAYLLQQNQSEPIATGDGALVGLFAGVAGSVVYLILTIPVTLVFAPLERRFVERMFEMAGSLPPDVRGTMSGYVGAGVGIVIGFCFMLFFGSMFSTLGGVLGAAIFRKKPQTNTAM